MQIVRLRTFWRLFGAFALLVVLSNTLLGFVVVRQVQDDEVQQIEEALRIKTLVVEEEVCNLPPAQQAKLQDRIMRLQGILQTRITLVAPDGQVLADSLQNPQSMENHSERHEIIDAERSGTGTHIHYNRVLGQPMMYLARHVDCPSSVAYIRVARPLTSVQAQLSRMRYLIWAVVVLTAVGALIMAYLLARLIARPLQELTAGVERIAAGEYGSKVYQDGTDETGILARAFNTMSQRLATQFARLEEDRQQLRAVLTGMVEGVIAIDREERILFANDSAGRLLDFAGPVTAGRKLWEVVRWPAVQELVSHTWKTDELLQKELTWNGPGVKNLMVHVAPLSGRPDKGAILVLHDTTELRRLEQVRQEFVANISHELKTPLTAIVACVETLLDGAAEDPEYRQTFLQQIDDQADRMHHLIVDLLTLTRIESGAETYEICAVDVDSVIDSTIERHRAQAEAKQIKLEGFEERNDNAKGRKAVTAWVDEEALGTILDNLVDNALKYANEGGQVAIRWGSQDSQVYLKVEDTGIGIPERDLPRIFERFYRVDKARSRELGGTGLGLSIVKHLVQAMKGSITASSQLGHGTTFHLRLPGSSTG